MGFGLNFARFIHEQLLLDGGLVIRVIVGEYLGFADIKSKDFPLEYL